jgi:hypothetical protein
LSLPTPFIGGARIPSDDSLEFSNGVMGDELLGE